MEDDKAVLESDGSKVGLTFGLVNTPPVKGLITLNSY